MTGLCESGYGQFTPIATRSRTSLGHLTGRFVDRAAARHDAENTGISVTGYPSVPYVRPQEITQALLVGGCREGGRWAALPVEP